MIHTKHLEIIIRLTRASGYVKGEKPVSLLLLSDRPESGKSQLVTECGDGDDIAILSDVSAYALWRDFHQQIADGKIKHLIIPEFLAPLSKSNSESLIATLQMMIEEGLQEIHTGFLKPIRLPKPVVVGMIACMPRSAFLDRRIEWEMSGFLSRLLVVSFKYSQETVEAIFESIVDQAYLKKPQAVQAGIKFKATDVTIPRPVSLKCLNLANEITANARKTHKLYGFREVKNIICFVKANVVLENAVKGECRTEANLNDFAAIEEISYLFNEQFLELKA